MSLFFLISGFCFSYKDNYKEFLLKRIYRLLIPYIVFNLVDMLPRQLLPALVNRPASMMESLKQMLFYGGEYWFLYTLFIISTIYPVLHCWQRDSSSKEVIAELVLLVLYILEPKVSFLCLDSVFVYLLFFNTGVLLKKYIPHIFEWHFKEKWLQPVSTIFLLILWGVTSQFSATLKIASVAGILTCYLFTKLPWFNKIFHSFGHYSLQLYLLNGFLLVISRTIICKLTENPAIIICFNMLITFFLSYLFIKYFCDKVKWIQKLMGL